MPAAGAAGSTRRARVPDSGRLAATKRADPGADVTPSPRGPATATPGSTTARGAAAVTGSGDPTTRHLSRVHTDRSIRRMTMPRRDEDGRFLSDDDDRFRRRSRFDEDDD